MLLHGEAKMGKTMLLKRIALGWSYFTLNRCNQLSDKEKDIYKQLPDDEKRIYEDNDVLLVYVDWLDLKGKENLSDCFDKKLGEGLDAFIDASPTKVVLLCANYSPASRDNKWEKMVNRKRIENMRLVLECRDANFPKGENAGFQNINIIGFDLQNTQESVAKLLKERGIDSEECKTIAKAKIEHIESNERLMEIACHPFLGQSLLMEPTMDTYEVFAKEITGKTKSDLGNSKEVSEICEAYFKDEPMTVHQTEWAKENNICKNQETRKVSECIFTQVLFCFISINPNTTCAIKLLLLDMLCRFSNPEVWKNTIKNKICPVLNKIKSKDKNDETLINQLTNFVNGKITHFKFSSAILQWSYRGKIYKQMDFVLPSTICIDLYLYEQTKTTFFLFLVAQGYFVLKTRWDKMFSHHTNTNIRTVHIYAGEKRSLKYLHYICGKNIEKIILDYKQRKNGKAKPKVEQLINLFLHKHSLISKDRLIKIEIRNANVDDKLKDDIEYKLNEKGFQIEVTYKEENLESASCIQMNDLNH